jgi:hypothetical protein
MRLATDKPFNLDAVSGCERWSEVNTDPIAPVPRVMRRTGISGCPWNCFKSAFRLLELTEPSIRRNGMPLSVSKDSAMSRERFQKENTTLNRVSKQPSANEQHYHFPSLLCARMSSHKASIFDGYLPLGPLG